MFLYKFLLYLISYLSLPFFILKIFNNPQQWKQRLGLHKIPKDIAGCIWLHAASMGEVNAIKPVIKKLTKKYSNKNICITTMTKTGYENAAQLTRKFPNVYNFFVPLDLPFAVKNTFKKFKPEILIVTETELWPLLIHYSRKYGCKSILINGRMTEKSFREYKLFDPIFKEIISCFDFLSVQTKLDKKKFKYFTHKKVEVSGNIKFALDIPSRNKEDIKKRWKVGSDFIITLGSSRPGEEELLINLHKYLKEHKVKHQIILAPRHLERLNEIKLLLKKEEVNFATLSENKNSFDLLLIDKMGVLVAAYAVSNLAIVGGSFYDFGGHNPLEAAYFGLPIIMGKYYSSCKESVEILQKNCAILICDKDNLSKHSLHLIQNETKRENMGAAALKTLEANKESLGKTVQLINKLIFDKD
ncbi:MAG: 3-deoxy-D-manno-octulosonic acid transferase [Candidatus Cloacimonetes bacterium]|nr:3-deoxy-D-manno-octulosonic acid transferase [Candidatus Cloacimonadota bacterium]MBS3767153.1 3-deoxy-D-manno-octulosonic acid transferase [Candidatus Cloacimonadota bacterium]